MPEVDAALWETRRRPVIHHSVDHGLAATEVGQTADAVVIARYLPRLLRQRRARSRPPAVGRPGLAGARKPFDVAPPVSRTGCMRPHGAGLVIERQTAALPDAPPHTARIASDHHADRPAEARERVAEERCADHERDDERLPDHVEAGAAIGMPCAKRRAGPVAQFQRGVPRGIPEAGRRRATASMRSGIDPLRHDVEDRRRDNRQRGRSNRHESGLRASTEAVPCSGLRASHPGSPPAAAPPRRTGSDA